jgi:hypothetical protein
MISDHLRLDMCGIDAEMLAQMNTKTLAVQVSTGTQYCGAGPRLACDIRQRVRRVGYDKQYGLGRSVHDLRHDVAVNFGVLSE